jgi:peroxiredoxin
MQDPERTPDAPRSSRGKTVVVAFAVLVVLYFGITNGIRWYVSSQIHKSEGVPMPEFELKDLKGQTWTTANLRGKTTVLNFFRSRCPNCLKERDVIRQLHRDGDPSKVQIIGVMTDKVVGYEADVTERTLERFDYQHPILMADRQFIDAFHGAGWAHVTPITYVVDAQGRITHALRGHQTLDTLRSATR